MRKLKNIILESDGYIGLLLYTSFFVLKYGFKRGVSMGIDNKWFDLWYGTSTTTTKTNDENYVVNIDSNNIKYAVESTADKVTRFRRAMSVVKGEGLEKFYNTAFIDYGCGKGRVLILASKYGFKRIMGVEISSSMLDICRSNLSVVKVKNVVLYEKDAVNFQAPRTSNPRLHYFYNPFTEVVFNRVIKNIADERQGPVQYIVYSNPQHLRVFDSSRFTCIYQNSSEKLHIYRT